MSKNQKTSEQQLDAIGNGIDWVLNNPGVEEQLSKLCIDALSTFAAEAKEMTAEQFVFVPDLALTIFITALSHSATPSDAEHAVIAACRSLPTAITSANLVSEKSETTEEKLVSKVTTASEMISRAAVSALPSVNKEDRDAIKIGIQSNINFSCFLQRKGKKFFDPKAGLDAYNIGWLKPVESKLSGGAGDVAFPSMPDFGNISSELFNWTNSSSTPSFNISDFSFIPESNSTNFTSQTDDIPKVDQSDFKIPEAVDFGNFTNTTASDFPSEIFYKLNGQKVSDMAVDIVNRVNDIRMGKQSLSRYGGIPTVIPVQYGSLFNSEGKISLQKNPDVALETIIALSNPEDKYYITVIPRTAALANIDASELNRAGYFKYLMETPTNSSEYETRLKSYKIARDLFNRLVVSNFDYSNPLNAKHDLLVYMTSLVSEEVQILYRDKFPPNWFKENEETLNASIRMILSDLINKEGDSFYQEFSPPSNWITRGVYNLGRHLLFHLEAWTTYTPMRKGYTDIFFPRKVPKIMSSEELKKLAIQSMDKTLGLDKRTPVKPPSSPPLQQQQPLSSPANQTVVNQTPPQTKTIEEPSQSITTEEPPKLTPKVSPIEPNNATTKTEEQIIQEIKKMYERFENFTGSFFNNTQQIPQSEKKWFGSYLWSFIKGIADVSLKLLSYGKYGWKILKYTFEIAGIVVSATIGVKLTLFMKTKYEDGSLGAKLQSVIRTVLGGAKAVSDVLTSNPDINERMKKITKAVKQLAPVMAQDYIAYQNRMRAYQDQQTYRKALFDRQEEQRRYDIQRQNAIFMANEKRAREEALLHNKQELTRQETDKKYLEELAQYHKKLEQAEKDFREKERKYLELQGKRNDDEASRRLLRQSRKEYANAAASAAGLIADIAGMVLSPPAALATAAVGALGNAGAPAAPGAHPGGYFNPGRLQHFADTADEYTRLAEQARDLGNFRLAERYEREADANLKHFHQIYDMSRSELKSNETRFYKGLTSFGRFGSDLVHGISDWYFGKKDTEEAERLKNREVLIPPRKDYVGPAPLRAPYMPNLRYVPEEVKEDDPRLVKYVKREYIPEPMPADMYSTPRTYQFVNSAPPKVKKQKFSPGEGLSELPYVTPIPVMRVNPSSGAKSTLKTQVTPVYHPNTQIHLKGVPQKKARKH